MADACFSEPRLAEIYDALDGDRSDLELYVAIASELGASSVLDVGCGTGVLACRLAADGYTVAGVDPAEASLGMARAKPCAERVRWVVGEADAYDGPAVDLVTMTGNVAQVFVTDVMWTSNLAACGAALRPNGWLVFETRDPAREAWLQWTREQTARQAVVPGVGEVEVFCQVIEVRPPIVSFRWTYAFEADGTVMTSDSTLRFRDRDEIQATLEASGFVVRSVRDAPDRPGAEMIFLAQRKTSDDAGGHASASRISSSTSSVRSQL